jgi:hypothetical protein
MKRVLLAAPDERPGSDPGGVRPQKFELQGSDPGGVRPQKLAQVAG